MLKKFLNLFRRQTPPTPAEDLSNMEKISGCDVLYEPPLFSLSGGDDVNPIYDNYPNELPPDWEARRRETLEVDGYTCQAPGCLRQGRDLHAHHLVARWEGGNHHLTNLVTLCPVHHAIVHLDTNEVRVSELHCTIVSRHWRRKPFSHERTKVRLFMRRGTLISAEQRKAITEQFALKCNWCGSKNWECKLRSRFLKRALLWTWCPNCNGRWEFEQGLVEETGTHLAMAFIPIKLGRFKFDLDLIRGLQKPASFEGCPECLNQGRKGYLKKIKGKYGAFIGCSEFPACRYRRNS